DARARNGDADALQSLAKLRSEELGDAEAAVEAWTRLLAVDPTHAQAREAQLSALRAACDAESPRRDRQGELEGSHRALLSALRDFASVAEDQGDRQNTLRELALRARELGETQQAIEANEDLLEAYASEDPRTLEVVRALESSFI